MYLRSKYSHKVGGRESGSQVGEGSGVSKLSSELEGAPIPSMGTVNNQGWA